MPSSHMPMWQCASISPGQHKLARKIDHVRTGRGKICANSNDLAVVEQKIAGERLLRHGMDQGRFSKAT